MVCLFEIPAWVLALIHQQFIDCQTQKIPTSLIYPDNWIKLEFFPILFGGRDVYSNLQELGIHFWVLGETHDGIHDSPLTISSTPIGTAYIVHLSCDAEKRRKKHDQFFSGTFCRRKLFS